VGAHILPQHPKSTFQVHVTLKIGSSGILTLSTSSCFLNGALSAIPPNSGFSPTFSVNVVASERLILHFTLI
jgi:hypothetical protein